MGNDSLSQPVVLRKESSGPVKSEIPTPPSFRSVSRREQERAKEYFFMPHRDGASLLSETNPRDL
jgi:hypothetical protein